MQNDPLQYEKLQITSGHSGIKGRTRIKLMVRWPFPLSFSKSKYLINPCFFSPKINLHVYSNNEDKNGQKLYDFLCFRAQIPGQPLAGGNSNTNARSLTRTSIRNSCSDQGLKIYSSELFVSSNPWNCDQSVKGLQ